MGKICILFLILSIQDNKSLDPFFLFLKRRTPQISCRLCRPETLRRSYAVQETCLPFCLTCRKQQDGIGELVDA